MRIQLNGEGRELKAEITVAELVRELGLLPEQVAVERNRELVPRGKHVEMVLAEGDDVEVVTLVGGG